VTPAQKAFGAVLQVSLFKWGDATGEFIESLVKSSWTMQDQDLLSTRKELMQVTMNVETAIDGILYSYITDPSSIDNAFLDQVNSRIVKLKDAVKRCRPV
jgi:hypothetical protein